MSSEAPPSRSAEARRALAMVRREGPRSVFFKGLGRSGLLRRLRILELPMTRLDEQQADLPAGLEFAELGDGDPDMRAGVVALNPYSALRSVTELDARLERGYRCFVVHDGSRPLAAAWAADEVPVPMPYLHCEIPLIPEAACSFESFTDASLRGRGIGASLRIHLARKMAASGASLIQAMVSPGSAAPMAMVAKLGYVGVGWAVTLRVGRWQRSRVRFDDGRPTPQPARPDGRD
jgi:hypothetical protein